MTIHMLRDTLLYCAIINYAVILLWFLVFCFAHGWIYRLHRRWFRLSIEQFDTVHYAGLAVYKVGILLLNVVPYLALVLLS
jgi:hypothetical protein